MGIGMNVYDYDIRIHRLPSILLLPKKIPINFSLPLKNVHGTWDGAGYVLAADKGNDMGIGIALGMGWAGS